MAIITRCVEGTPTSEDIPITILYIHPPHHGQMKVPVMAVNDGLISLSFRAMVIDRYAFFFHYSDTDANVDANITKITTSNYDI